MTNISGLGAKQIQQYLNVESGQPKSGLMLNTEQKARATVMSGAELMQKMGGVPKSSFTIGSLSIFSRSKEYKATVSELTKFHAMVETFGDVKAGSSKGSIGQLKAQLQKVIDAAQTYEDKHARSDDKAGRRDIMANLREVAVQEMSNLDTVISEMKLKHGDDISLRDALGLHRSGVTNTAQVSQELTDANMKGPPKFLGKGSINEVSIVTYKLDTNREDTRVLKPLHEKTDILIGKEGGIGIDKNDLRIAARNIASSVVADFLGLGAMVPKPDVVLHEGEGYLAMPLAPGEPFLGRFETPFDQGMQSQLTGWEHDFPENIEMMKAERNTEGVWVKKGDAPRDLPLESGGDRPKLAANLQKALLDLQVVDVLCGQIDRHQFNFFVKVEGNNVKLTGIDNDAAFGKNTTGINGIDDRDTKLGKGVYPGAPPLMSSDTFNSLMSIDAVDYGNKLAVSGLSQDEIDASLSRLEKLQAHATELQKNGCVVENFETWKGKDPKTGEDVNVSEFVKSSQKNKINDSYLEAAIAIKGTLGQQRAPTIPLDPLIHQLN
jgi:hypothetical protein